MPSIGWWLSREQAFAESQPAGQISPRESLDFSAPGDWDIKSESSIEGVEYGALGGIRTPDTWFRRPVLYPLSYERFWIRSQSITASAMGEPHVAACCSAIETVRGLAASFRGLGWRSPG